MVEFTLRPLKERVYNFMAITIKENGKVRSTGWLGEDAQKRAETILGRTNGEGRYSLSERQGEVLTVEYSDGETTFSIPFIRFHRANRPKIFYRKKIVLSTERKV